MVALFLLLILTVLVAMLTGPVGALILWAAVSTVVVCSWLIKGIMAIGAAADRRAVRQKEA